MTGLVLLVIIGIIVAYFWTRFRSKMKLNISGKNWAGPIIVVVALVLMLWASHNGH